MAARRFLSTTSKTGNERTRLAIAGSLVAFSASLSVSALLMASNESSSAQKDTWDRLLQSKITIALPLAVQSWVLGNPSWNFATGATLKTLQNINEDITEEDSIEGREEVRAEKLKITTAISETFRNRFQVGDSYVWLYRDADRNPTSWEKYTITDIQDRHLAEELPEFVVTIEMSTKFEEDADYRTHHRIKANLIDHFLESSKSRNDWRIDFEYFASDDKPWHSQGDGDNVEAFEEKFDIFSMVSSEHSSSVIGGSRNSLEKRLISLTLPPTTNCETSSSNCITRSALLSVNSIGSTKKSAIAKRKVTSKLMQTKRHAYTKAWYGPHNHDTLSGIAVYKEFPTSQHSFVLIERTTRIGNAPVTDVIEVVV